MRLASTGGAPVWTDKANPVASSWIEACQNLDGKKAGLFMTCRFRAGGSPEALLARLESKGANIGGSLVVKSLFGIGAAKLEQARAFRQEISESLS